VLETLRTLLREGTVKLAANVDVAEAEEARALRLAAATGGAPAPEGAPPALPGTSSGQFCARCREAVVPVDGWWCFECHAAFARGSGDAPSRAA
jgi:hypothetical protein